MREIRDDFIVQGLLTVPFRSLRLVLVKFWRSCLFIFIEIKSSIIYIYIILGYIYNECFIILIIIFNKHRLSGLWRVHPDKTHTILTSVRKTCLVKVLLVKFSRSQEKLMG